LFLDVFEGIVEQCKQAGLIQGKAVVTDSTHIEANVNDALRETVTVTKEPREYFKTLEATARELQANLDTERKGKKRGPKGSGSVAKAEEREEVRSKTDPDAAILGRPGKPSGFHYLRTLEGSPRPEAGYSPRTGQDARATTRGFCSPEYPPNGGSYAITRGTSRALHSNGQLRPRTRLTPNRAPDKT